MAETLVGKMTGSGEKKKFLVSVRVPFSLETVIEARDKEEARRVAMELEPDQFDNFHTFYEYLGDEFRHLKHDMEIEELSV